MMQQATFVAPTPFLITRRIIAALSAAILCLSCAAVSRENSPKSDTLELPSSARPTELEQLLGPGKVVFVGEVHGTEEMPAAFAELVMEAAKSSDVLVILEFPTTVAPLLIQLSISNERDSALQSIASSAFFKKTNDGRTSGSMLKMIAALSERSDTSGPIEFAAMDKPGSAGTSREEAMAIAVKEARLAHPNTTLFVYCGNLHARTTADPAMPYGDSMASQLIADGLDVTGIRLLAEGGTFWGCTASGCGENALPEPNPLSKPLSVGKLFPSSDSRYSFDVNVGRATAAPPLRQD
jgi:hypothetical protein